MEVSAIIRLPRLNPGRTLNGTPVRRNFNHVLIADSQATRGIRAEKDGVIPGELCHGARQFLQPRVVRITAIQDIGVGTERERERWRCYLRRTRDRSCGLYINKRECGI